MRRGRNARVGALPQTPGAARGHRALRGVRRPRRSGVAGRGDALAPRHGRRARHADRPAVGRAAQARRARRAARPRVGCAHPRRADQPPRPRRHRLPRGMARRVPGRPAPRDPRSSRARPRHEQGARDRPRRDLPPRSARTDGRIRVRGVPRGADRSRSAGRDGRADAQEPRAPRARVAAAGRAGAHVEAEGAHRRRQRPARARSRGERTRGRARPGARQHATGIEGRRAPRRRLLVARRATAATPGRCSS